LDNLRSHIEQFIKISDEEWSFFASKFEYKEFPKKETILKIGKVENYLSFIESGIIRFFIPGDENDLTFVFAFDGWFVSAYDSFITQEPSTYEVETLTKTNLYRISYKDLQNVYKKTSFGNFIGRMASEQLFLYKTKRELSLLKDSAEQRYIKLFTEQPHFLQHIPQKYLASFLGITPQALSRIRKRIS
jgi:CRP-like cAMP-binding protein